MRGTNIPEPAQKTAAATVSGPPERGPADEAAVDARTPTEQAPGSRPPAGGPDREHRRGRPRSKRADSAILRAATDLLAERGLGGMSIEEVASRAGVGKATIYRRWPSRGALVLDAFDAEFLAQQPLPDTGTLRGDLLSALRAWIRSVTQTSAGTMLVGMIAEVQQDRALAEEWRDRAVRPVRAQHAIMLDRAISRGEIPADTDKDVVIDLLFGPAYHRLLHGHLPLTDQFARRVVDLIVAGLSADRPGPGGPPTERPSPATARGEAHL
jgi:AcrR family transcriptional regulator